MMGLDFDMKISLGNMIVMGTLMLAYIAFMLFVAALFYSATERGFACRQKQSMEVNIPSDRARPA